MLQIEVRKDLWLEVFYQKEGINYEETFAPVARYTSIRATMELASMMKWDLDGCENSFSKWCDQRRSIHRTTTRI